MFDVDQWMRVVITGLKRPSSAQQRRIKDFLSEAGVDLTSFALRRHGSTGHLIVTMGPDGDTCIDLDFTERGVDAWAFRDGEIASHVLDCSPKRFVELLRQEEASYEA